MHERQRLRNKFIIGVVGEDITLHITCTKTTKSLYMFHLVLLQPLRSDDDDDVEGVMDRP